VLRSLVLALLLANAVYFVWRQGGFAGVAGVPIPDPTADQREPQRLAAQVNPERITVLPPASASASASAPAADPAADGAHIGASPASAPASASVSAPAASAASPLNSAAASAPPG
jgi:hypothetical protein